MNTLKDNIRLLESLTIKSTISDVAGVPGSPENLFLLCKILLLYSNMLLPCTPP